MQWTSVASNQTCSWDSLINACNNGYFLQLLPMPPSGVPAGRCVRKELIQSYIEIQSAPLSGVPNNELVVKSQLVAITYTYYQLTACDGGAGAWTRISPTLGVGQRYVLPGFTNRFFLLQRNFTRATNKHSIGIQRINSDCKRFNVLPIIVYLYINNLIST